MDIKQTAREWLESYIIDTQERRIIRSLLSEVQRLEKELEDARTK